VISSSLQPRNIVAQRAGVRLLAKMLKDTQQLVTIKVRNKVFRRRALMERSGICITAAHSTKIEFIADVSYNDGVVNYSN
jgi:hypothetical protein